ncbi:hypothetical protein J6590_030419 [Homalodisca vitripennis]|nr:hypothetical protein J6590_030419 [Homalodisca vitripennis]
MGYFGSITFYEKLPRRDLFSLCSAAHKARNDSLWLTAHYHWHGPRSLCRPAPVCPRPGKAEPPALLISRPGQSVVHAPVARPPLYALQIKMPRRAGNTEMIYGHIHASCNKAPQSEAPSLSVSAENHSAVAGIRHNSIDFNVRSSRLSRDKTGRGWECSGHVYIIAANCYVLIALAHLERGGAVGLIMRYLSDANLTYSQYAIVIGSCSYGTPQWFWLHTILRRPYSQVLYSSPVHHTDPPMANGTQ